MECSRQDSPFSPPRRISQWFLAVSLLATFSTGHAVAVELIGYLPYYRLNPSYVANVLPAQLELLAEVRYFGLSVGNTGEITSLSGSVASHKSNIEMLRNLIAGLPAGSQPRLTITLGGADQDVTFTSVAASSTLRDTLALNVESLLNETQAGAVDIDWEHPDAGVQRTTHYPALLQRLKQQLGSARRVNATVDPTVTIPSSVFNGPYGIDGVSLMTYDLGWWGNDPGNPLTGEHSVSAYVEDSVEAWTELPGSTNDRPWVFGSWGVGAPAANLGVGLPFYGRDVANSTAYTYAQLSASATTVDGNYYNYLGRTVWIPGPSLAEQRVAYATEKGLGHLIIWEIGQDLPPSHPDSLLRRAYDAREALAPRPGDYDGDGQIGQSDYELWRTTFASTTDLRADGNSDGAVDAADYTIWRDNRDGPELASSPEVSEPASFCIASATLYVLWPQRRQITPKKLLRSQH